MRLIVQNKQNSIIVLLYVKKSIKQLNKIGIYFEIEKISDIDVDKELMIFLERQGITRLPSLITKTGKIIIGKEIITFLEKKIKMSKLSLNTVNMGKNSQKSTKQPQIAKSNVENFWMNELFNVDGGKIIPKKDEDECVGEEKVKFDQKMVDYEKSKRVEKTEKIEKTGTNKINTVSFDDISDANDASDNIDNDDMYRKYVNDLSDD